MAKEIYTKGNYVFVDDEIAIIRRFPKGGTDFGKDAVLWRLTNRITKEEFTINIADVADWYDELGTTPYSESTLDALLEDNTGFNTPQVGGGLFGTLDYSDLETQTTPIVVTGGGGFVKLTNDGAGAQTNKDYAPTNITDVWSIINDEFDFNQLKLGDVMSVRIDIEVTTVSTNTDVRTDLVFGVGVSEYSIPFIRNSFKVAGTYQLNSINSVYMGNALTLDNPAEFRIQADKNITVKVIGWVCFIHKY